MSTVEENKRLAVHFLELISQHRLKDLCGLITPDWALYGGPPQLPRGPAGLRALFDTFGRIAQTWSIEDVIGEGDKVLVRATNTCEQDSFFGVPGRGQEQRFSAMFLFRMSEGKIAEVWRNADDLGRIFQLGGRVVAGKP